MIFKDYIFISQYLNAGVRVIASVPLRSTHA